MSAQTITKKVYVVAMHFTQHLPSEVSWAIWTCQPADTGGPVIGWWEHEVTLPLPSADGLAALEAAKLKALQDYQKSVASLNERLQQLQAIANEAGT